MVRFLLAVAAVTAALTLGWRGAEAGQAPWCVVTSIGWGDVVWDCSYWSFKQCTPNAASGFRGFCEPNPYYVASGKLPMHHKRSR